MIRPKLGSTARSATGGTGVPGIRQLGTTWATRGPRYWLRRAGLSFVLGMAAVFFVAAYAGILHGLWQVTHGAVAHAVVAVIVIGAAVWSIAAAIRAYYPTIVAERDEDLDALRAIVGHRSPAARRRAGAGVAVGGAALAGSTAAGGVLAFGAVLLIGVPIVMFLMSLRRYCSAAEALAVLESRRQVR
jgi:hypothetical protein